VLSSFATNYNVRLYTKSETAITAACAAGAIDVLKVLVAAAEFHDFETREFETVMQATARMGHSDLIRELSNLGREVQVGTHVCTQVITRPSPWVSNSMPVCDTL
jgi:hypothetical protein